MISKVVNLVLQFLKEHYPTLRIKDGAIWDLYVKAFSILFNEEIGLLEGTFASLDLRNYATMTETSLDRVASYYFLSRVTGNRASAIVSVTVGNANPMTIRGGVTTFSTAQGLKFVAAQDQYFSSSQILSMQYGSYFRVQIPVVAFKEGAVYNVGVGEINSLETPIGQAYIVEVRNDAAAVSGANRESNTELYMRIVQSINTRELLITRNSVSTVILNNFPTVRAVQVVGKGDDLMQRDRMYAGPMPGGFNPYQKSGFEGKRAGVIRFNSSIAYKGRLSSLAIPDPDDLEENPTEFTQSDYYALIAADLEYAESRGALEMLDDFELPPGTSLVSKTQEIRGWVATDSGFPFGIRKYGDSVTIFNGHLCLGPEDISITRVRI